MTAADVLQATREVLLLDDADARARLADMFEEAGDEEMVNLLREGLRYSVAWGEASAIRDCHAAPGTDAVEDYVFHSREAKRSFVSALIDHDGWADCYCGERAEVEDYVRSLYPEEEGEPTS